MAAGDITLTADSNADEFWAYAQSNATSPGTNDPVPSGDTFRGVDFGFGFSLDAAINFVVRRTTTMVRDLDSVTAPGALVLTSSSTPLLVAVAGATASGNHVGVGGAFAGNWVTNVVRAILGDADIDAGSVSLTAESETTQLSFTDGVAVSTATLSIGGSVNFTVATNTAEASIGDRTTLTTAPNLSTPGVRGTATVTAGSTVRIVTDAGASAFTEHGLVVLGAALDLATVTNAASSSVGASADVLVGSLALDADTAEQLRQFAAATAVAAVAGEPARLYRNRGPPQGFLDETTPGEDASRSDLTTSVALGDVNGDGHLDLVVGNFGQFNRRYLWDPALNLGLRRVRRRRRHRHRPVALRHGVRRSRPSSSSSTRRSPT